LIVKSTVRELTRNWTTDIHLKSRKEIPGYFWYNGSTSFDDGEKLKRKREDEVKSKLRKDQKKKDFPYQRHET